MDNYEKHVQDFVLGVAEATNALISEKLEVSVNKSLKILGEYLNAGTGFVFVNHQNDQGEWLCSVRYAWAQEVNLERRGNNQNVPFSILGGSFETLNSGQVFEQFLSQSSGSFKQHMQSDGTQSLIMFPIFIDNQLWGGLGLSETRFERTWQPYEKSLLQSFANSIGGAVSRHRLEENLESLVEQRTKELNKSQQRFKLAVEGSQDGIWDWQPKTGESYWSPRLYQQLGYQYNEFPTPKEDFFQMVHPDEVEMARERFNSHLNDRIPYEVEFRLKTKSGAYRWFKSTGQAQWDENGEVVRMVGSHEDIHDRKMSRQLLEKSEQKFRAVIENDPNATFLVNLKGEIQLHSNRAVSLFGYSKQELMKMKIHDLVPESFRATHVSHFNQYSTHLSARMMGGIWI